MMKPLGAITGKTLALVDPPFEPMVASTRPYRIARDIARPSRTRVLALGIGDLVIDRGDRCTLNVSSDRGLMTRTADLTVRVPFRDLPRGAVVVLPGTRVAIEHVRPEDPWDRCQLVFDRDLDDPQLVWMKWTGDEFVRFRLPAPGRVEEVPVIDLFDVFTRP